MRPGRLHCGGRPGPTARRLPPSRTDLRRLGGVLLIAALAAPTAAAVAVRRGHWQVFDVTAGLPSPGINHILQDRRGDLWFAGKDGATRFDGTEFVALTAADGLPANGVNVIFEDRDGVLWFGTRNGVARCDGTTATAVPLPLSDPWISAIGQDAAGALWFGAGNPDADTPGGLVRYADGVAVAFSTRDGLADDGVLAILRDRRGRMWFGTKGGISRLDGAVFRTYTRADGLADAWINAIAEDGTGGLWFGTGNPAAPTAGGACRFDGAAFTCYDRRQGLAYDWVLTLCADSRGDLWLGTQRGLSRFDGRAFHNLGTADGLPHNWVQAAFESREGALWFGTLEGVARLEPDRLSTYAVTDTLKRNSVYAVLAGPAGQVWFGTWGGGALRSDGTAFTALTTRDGLPDDYVWSLLRDREGDVWLGTGGGATRVRDGQLLTLTVEQGLAGNWVSALGQDRAGTIWLGTGDPYADAGGGISAYDGNRVTTFTEVAGASGPRVRAILEDGAGRLWFGTEGDGLIRYERGAFARYTRGDGLPDDRVLSLAEGADGSVWIGTMAGAARFDGERFHGFGVADGLTYGIVRSILVDSRGRLWFATWGGGVTRYDGLVVQSLTHRSGLAHNLAAGIVQDEGGDVWIATEGGVTRYRSRASPPSITLTGVTADRAYAGDRDLRLSTSQDLVTFEFRGRSFGTPRGELAYVYRLAGAHAAWRTTRLERVSYEDLPLGEYAFEVKAVDRDLVYSAAPAQVRLTVHLPYGELGLYGLLAAALVALTGASAYAVRQKRERDLALRERSRALEEANARLQEADQLKSDFVSNVSHDLRTPLTSIKGSVDNLLDGIVGQVGERQRRYLVRVRANVDRLAHLIDDLLDMSRIEAGRLEIHAAVVPLDRIAREVLDALQPIAAGKDIALELTAGDPVAAMADADRVYQILTNLVGNGIKFTPPGGRVRIDLSAADATALVQVADTGPGIPADQLEAVFARFHRVPASGDRGPGAGLGLAIARALVELQGGRIWAQSTEGQGSRFRFTLPRADREER